MSNLRKAAEQALDFVTSTQWGKRDYMDYGCYVDAFVLADALRAALAEPDHDRIDWAKAIERGGSHDTR